MFRQDVRIYQDSRFTPTQLFYCVTLDLSVQRQDNQILKLLSCPIYFFIVLELYQLKTFYRLCVLVSGQVKSWLNSVLGALFGEEVRNGKTYFVFCFCFFFGKLMFAHVSVCFQRYTKEDKCIIRCLNAVPSSSCFPPAVLQTGGLQVRSLRGLRLPRLSLHLLHPDRHCACVSHNTLQTAKSRFTEICSHFQLQFL